MNGKTMWEIGHALCGPYTEETQKMHDMYPNFIEKWAGRYKSAKFADLDVTRERFGRHATRDRRSLYPLGCTPPRPEESVSQLDPVQIAALDFARGKKGVGFFLEQGLGKSLIVLTEFSFLQAQGVVDRMIIITPNTFKRVVQDEIDKHGFRFDVHIWQSAKKADALAFLSLGYHSKGPPVLIINYDAARMSGVLRALCIWAARGKAYLAIDESIQIKGPKSLQTKAMQILAPTCLYTRLLTGRPQTQGPHDLWGQLRAIGVLPGVNFYAFRGRYCVMGGWQDKEVLAAKNVDELARTMAPVVFQARRRIGCPSCRARITRSAITRCRPSSGVSTTRWSTSSCSRSSKAEHGRGRERERAKLERSCVFIYDESGAVHELVKPLANPRLNLLLQLLHEEVAGKVCVVYRHRAMLPFRRSNLIDRVDPETGEVFLYDCAWIGGGMKPDEVSEQKARFNEDPACRVILLQCDAAKYGHTLLGGPGPDDKCRTMCFFENSYSADTRDQIEDRYIGVDKLASLCCILIFRALIFTGASSRRFREELCIAVCLRI